jgi:hypothetical protein
MVRVAWHVAGRCAAPSAVDDPRRCRGAQINEVKERIAMKEGELIDIEAEFAVPYHTPQPHRLAPAPRALAWA